MGRRTKKTKSKTRSVSADAQKDVEAAPKISPPQPATKAVPKSKKTKPSPPAAKKQNPKKSGKQSKTGKNKAKFSENY